MYIYTSFNTPLLIRHNIFIIIVKVLYAGITCIVHVMIVCTPYTKQHILFLVAVLKIVTLNIHIWIVLPGMIE